jgi:hypothetical protein
MIKDLNKLKDNPRLIDLQLLNCNIGRVVWGNIKYKQGIKILDHKHALELYKEQQELYRKNKILYFEELPF